MNKLASVSVSVSRNASLVLLLSPRCCVHSIVGHTGTVCATVYMGQLLAMRSLYHHNTRRGPPSPGARGTEISCGAIGSLGRRPACQHWVKYINAKQCVAEPPKWPSGWPHARDCGDSPVRGALPPWRLLQPARVQRGLRYVTQSDGVASMPLLVARWWAWVALCGWGLGILIVLGCDVCGCAWRMFTCEQALSDAHQQLVESLRRRYR